MARNIPLPVFPVPPREYDPRYMAELTRVFALYQQQMQNPGEARATSIVVTNMPTSPTGLEPGTLYVDGSGFVKLAP